ncbi:hypothetical protein D3C72_1115710 [compost metagenome]
MHAKQQVVQAMALLADQYQQAWPAAPVMQLPVHAEVRCQCGHRLVHGVQRQARIAVEVHAQEEATALLVAELLGVEDVAAVVEQQARHAIDDAGAVGTGEGEDGIGAHCPSVGQHTPAVHDAVKCNHQLETRRRARMIGASSSPAPRQPVPVSMTRPSRTR